MDTRKKHKTDRHTNNNKKGKHRTDIQQQNGKHRYYDKP